MNKLDFNRVAVKNTDLAKYATNEGHIFNKTDEENALSLSGY
jgi:hypothetical protein